MEFAESINEQLAYLYSNGKGEAGLETGVDVGLSTSEFIRIPKSMKKSWAARISTKVWKEQKIDPKKVKIYAKGDDLASFVDQEGWVTNGKIRIMNGIHEVSIENNGLRTWVQIDEFHIEPHTIDDMRNFYTVNINHIRDDEIPNESHMWVHAVRMWAVMGGLVTEQKNREFIFVNDPDAIDHSADAFVAFAIKYAPNAWTAAAARTTSWKKSNHATGGSPAIGLPRRWMMKEGYWPNFVDRPTQNRGEHSITNAFYISSHATSVHAVLAQFAPGDNQHWCILDPSCGMILNWDIGESIKVRMNPRDQVAGVSMVTDAMVVLKMLVSEGLAPVLENIGQAQALKQAHDTVKGNGMACAIYRRWYFDGYPLPNPAVEFNQRDPSFFELVSELAIIAVKFYSTSTIAQSPTLKNVAAQSSFENIKAIWANAAITRSDLSQNELTRLINLVRGSISTAHVADILSDDGGVSLSGKVAYNLQLETLSRLVGIENPKRLDTSTE